MQRVQDLAMAETSFGKPYTDLKTNGIHQRVFNFDVEDKELIWHRDKLDRKIKVVSGVNWKLQMDNELPEVLKVGNEYNIPKMVYHRLHKGEGRLIIDINIY